LEIAMKKNYVMSYGLLAARMDICYAVISNMFNVYYLNILFLYKFLCLYFARIDQIDGARVNL